MIMASFKQADPDEIFQQSGKCLLAIKRFDWPRGNELARMFPIAITELAVYRVRDAAHVGGRSTTAHQFVLLTLAARHWVGSRDGVARRLQHASSRSRPLAERERPRTQS